LYRKSAPSFRAKVDKVARFKLLLAVTGEGKMAAASIEIDLDAPTIPVDQRVWRMFPGSGYQFLDTFLDRGQGFLDFPGFVMPEGKLSDAKDLIARVARSQHISERLRKIGPDADTYADLGAFKTARPGNHRARLRQAIINLFEAAKKGDFIILPSPTFMSRVWVGRITDNKIYSALYPKRYGDNKIPARAIRWMAEYPENQLSIPLSTSLRNQHPFTVLEKSLHVEVFSLAYGSFVYGDRHAATVYNDLADFLDSDAAFLGVLSRLAAAAAKSVDEGRAGLGVEEIVDILLRSPPLEYTCSQASDIHSPGFNRYVAGNLVPLVIGAAVATLIGLAAFSSKQNLAQDAQNLTITNSALNADPHCTARVSEASKRVLEALGIERTWALCEAARAAKERAGLRSSATPKKGQSSPNK
jgi:hypothetical protein